MSELNDPRVFFAAERTLLAWNRTSLALMAFGFVIERFSLLITLIQPQHVQRSQASLSFWIGLIFVLLGAWVAGYSTLQYGKLLKTLKPIEIPEGYRTSPGVLTNWVTAFLGILLIIYFFQNI